MSPIPFRRLSRFAPYLLALSALTAAQVAQAQTYQLKQWVVDIKPTYTTNARWATPSISLGPVVLHQTVQQYTNLFNDGNATADFSTLSGTGSGITVDAAQCGAVSAGASCAVAVTFTPVVGTTYTVSGIKPIAATGRIPTLYANTLTVSGMGVQGVVGASATNLSFASQDVGTTSAVKSSILTNTGTAPVTFSGISVTANAAEFSQSNNCSTLVVNGTCTVSVAFTPGTVGSRTGTITLVGDGTGTSTISLSGTGTTAVANFTAGGLSWVLLSPTTATWSVGQCPGTIRGTTGWRMPTQGEQRNYLPSGLLAGFPSGSYWNNDYNPYYGGGGGREFYMAPGRVDSSALNYPAPTNLFYTACVK